MIDSAHYPEELQELHVEGSVQLRRFPGNSDSVHSIFRNPKIMETIAVGKPLKFQFDDPQTTGVQVAESTQVEAIQRNGDLVLVTTICNTRYVIGMTADKEQMA